MPNTTTPRRTAVTRRAPAQGRFARASTAGGFALIAAAAGMAFKSRDKLGRLRRKDSGRAPEPVVANNSTAVPPSTPTV